LPAIGVGKAFSLVFFAKNRHFSPYAAETARMLVGSAINLPTIHATSRNPFATAACACPKSG
jgi:hypothetical protein